MADGQGAESAAPERRSARNGVVSRCSAERIPALCQTLRQFDHNRLRSTQTVSSWQTASGTP